MPGRRILSELYFCWILKRCPAEASSHDIRIQTSALLDLTISCIAMWQGQSMLWFETLSWRRIKIKMVIYVMFVCMDSFHSQ